MSPCQRRCRRSRDVSSTRSRGKNQFRPERTSSGLTGCEKGSEYPAAGSSGIRGPRTLYTCKCNPTHPPPLTRAALLNRDHIILTVAAANVSVSPARTRRFCREFYSIPARCGALSCCMQRHRELLIETFEVLPVLRW